ncbi:unnamed protein product [Sphagnum troendelagicum]|uniref:GPI-anchored protein LLG1-like domain-containing protein n=1 Tax=Sphagnum troendelagicum TaxID=128251 RepID=A0ABP0UXT8_9BRYO
MRRCPQGNMGILKTPQLQLVLLVIWTLLFIEAAFPQLLNAAASEELSEKRLQIYEGSDIGARKLLQAVQQCPENFEVQNYSSITSVCVGPNYDSTLCCPPFVAFVCKFLTYFDDQSTDCASTLFSYLNLAGHYPPGLFANECKGGPLGIACPIAPAPSPDPSGVVLIRPKLSSLAFMSLFALLFRVLIF